MKNVHEILLPIVKQYEYLCENICTNIEIYNLSTVKKSAKKLGLRVVKNKSFTNGYTILPMDKRKFTGNRKTYKPVDIVDDFIHFCILDDKLDFILDNLNENIFATYPIIMLFNKEYLSVMRNIDSLYEAIEDYNTHRKHILLLKDLK